MFQQHLTTTFVIAEVLAFTIGACLVAAMWSYSTASLMRVIDTLRERLGDADVEAIRRELYLQDIKHTLAYGHLWRLPSVTEARNAWKGILTGATAVDARRTMGTTIIVMKGVGPEGASLLLRGRIVDNVAQFAAFLHDRDGLMGVSCAGDLIPASLKTEDELEWHMNIMDAYMDLLDLALDLQSDLTKTANQTITQDVKGTIMLPQGEAKAVEAKVKSARGPIEVDSPFPVDRKPMGVIDSPIERSTNVAREYVKNHEVARMENEGGIVLPTDDEVAVTNGHEPLAKTTPTIIPISHGSQGEALAADNDSRTNRVTLPAGPAVHITSKRDKAAPNNRSVSQDS
jgi:hypothetical protein